MFLDDSVRKRLLRLAPSQRTDDALYYLLAPHLLGFWTFLKPGFAGKEIGDVLFIFGDVCIIFEAKTRDKPGPTTHEWIGSKLREAVGQIKENHRRLESGEVSTIRNPWRGELPWSSLGIKHYQGVVVMMHESDPYDPLAIEPSLFDSCRIPIHVLSLYDIGELMRFLNTPWDFIVYWEFRYAIGKTHALFVHKEQSVFSKILNDWVELARGQGAAQSDGELLKDQQFLLNYTKAVMQSYEIDPETKRMVVASYLIDIAAGSIMQKADPDSTGKRVGSKDHSTHIKAVQLIADLSRRRRAVYGTLWMEAAKKCIATQGESYIYGYSPSREQSYIFCTRSGLDLDEDSLSLKAKERMKLDASSCVIVLSATATNIIQTFENLFAAIGGKNYNEEVPEILNTTALVIYRI